MASVSRADTFYQFLFCHAFAGKLALLPSKIADNSRKHARGFLHNAVILPEAG